MRSRRSRTNSRDVKIVLRQNALLWCLDGKVLSNGLRRVGGVEESEKNSIETVVQLSAAPREGGGGAWLLPERSTPPIPRIMLIECLNHQPVSRTLANTRRLPPKSGESLQILCRCFFFLSSDGCLMLRQSALNFNPRAFNLWRRRVRDCERFTVKD